jgi:hypothetical protein
MGLITVKRRPSEIGSFVPPLLKVVLDRVGAEQ